MSKKINVYINGIRNEKSEKEMEELYNEAINILSERDTKEKCEKLKELCNKINNKENEIVENAKCDDIYFCVSFSGTGLNIKEKIECKICDITVSIEQEEIDEEKRKCGIKN